jgi:pimeloyl-[acyl-carrier protein] synthase
MSADGGGELAPEEPVFFNPLDPEAHADPYPQYRRLREHAPMLRGPLGYWVLSRYADIAAVLRDPRFGVGVDEASLMLATTQDGPGVATMVELSRWMLFRDPPDHTRLRGLVSKAFTPRALEAVRPRVVEIVNRLIDDVAGRDEVDLIAELALPLPVTVISELLGLPIEDQAQARQWAEAIAQVLDPIVTEEQATRADRAVKELAAYIGRVVAQRRREPGPDLLSRLIQAEDGGAHLSEAELISTVGLLFDSPVQIAGRGARADVVIGGEHIAAGEPMMLLVGAANRDPARFPDPDRLDVRRPDVKMLSFGGGIHFCLGAMLARTEAQIAIGTLLARVPHLELATDDLQWRPHITLRGLSSLPVKVGWT